MVALMNGEDFINLQHQVGRHEGELDQQLKRVQELEKQVSELKNENAELTTSLKDAVLLVETIYGYLGVDRVTGRAEEVRRQIVKRFNDLRARLAIDESPFSDVS
jgi:chromosome segregation ATPase